MMTFTLTPARAAWVLSGIFLFLLVAHGTGLLMHYGLGHDHVFGLVPLFNMGREQSVPTLFATLLLLTNALLFFMLFRIDDVSRYRTFVWLLLSVAFCGVAVDEYTVMHERLIEPVREGLDVGGYLFFAWIIPYGIGVAILALVIGPAIWRLGRRYRWLFGACAVTFLGGAIGVEMLGGRYLEANQEQVDLNYRLFQTVEESLEFTGTILLIYTLLCLLRPRIKGLAIRLS